MPKRGGGVNAKQKNKYMKGKAKLSVIHDIWKSNKSARDMRHFEGKSRIGTLSVGRSSEHVRMPTCAAHATSPVLGL